VTPRGTDVETIQRTFAKGLYSDTFERHGLRRGTWDVSRDCENPVPVTLHSRATGDMRRFSRKGVRAMAGIELTMLTPCRMCRVCLRKKAKLWADRARSEIEMSERTWFGTMTCRPEVHYWIDSVCATQRANFHSLPREEQFGAQSRAMGIEVTKYLKRIRKNSGCSFRYLQVTEIHDSPNTADMLRGRPHVHMLIHEVRGQPIRKSVLDSAWHHGFSQWRLVANQGAAWYISKYISKASDARVRASLGYGGGHSEEI